MYVKSLIKKYTLKLNWQILTLPLPRKATEEAHENVIKKFKWFKKIKNPTKDDRRKLIDYIRKIYFALSNSSPEKHKCSPKKYLTLLNKFVYGCKLNNDKNFFYLSPKIL